MNIGLVASDGTNDPKRDTCVFAFICARIVNAAFPASAACYFYPAYPGRVLSPPKFPSFFLPEIYLDECAKIIKESFGAAYESRINELFPSSTL